MIACGPRCCKCLMLIPSGPQELFVLLFVIAFAVCLVVIWIASFGSLRICLSIFLLFLFDWWGRAVVKCLLKALAMSLSLCSGLLKFMVMFWCCGGFLFESVCTVLQSLCVLCR